MLVPSMTLEEIKHALQNDFRHELTRKVVGMPQGIARKWSQGGRKDYIETISHISKSKNHWRILVKVWDGHISIMPYMMAYDKVGITASHITDPSGTMDLLHFNTHFFKRYRERLNLDIEKPEDVIKQFFRKNTSILTGYYPMPDGTHQLFCPILGGLALGKFHEGLGIKQFKTFVDDSLLHENQKRDLAKVWRSALDQVDKKMMVRLMALYGNTWWNSYAE